MPSETTPAEPDSPDEVVTGEEHYHAILGMLVQSLQSAIPPESSAAPGLKDLAGDLGRPMTPMKLAEHRAALEGCMTSFQNDLSRLKQAIELGSVGRTPDSATGLPGPAEAQQLISSRLDDGQVTFAAILVLDQLRALNARFGRAVGDEVLKVAAQGLATAFDGAGILHRWRGPAFLVVCTKGQRQADDLGERIQKLVAKRLESTITVESRSIHVKITFTWQLQQVETSADVAAREYDDFVAVLGTGGTKGKP